MSAPSKAHTPEVPRAPIAETDEEYAALLDRAAAFGMVKPDTVQPDHAWFWTKDWLAGEIQASEETAEGQTFVQYSVDEFFAFLDELDRSADARRA